MHGIGSGKLLQSHLGSSGHAGHISVYQRYAGLGRKSATRPTDCSIVSSASPSWIAARWRRTCCL